MPRLDADILAQLACLRSLAPDHVMLVRFPFVHPISRGSGACSAFLLRLGHSFSGDQWHVFLLPDPHRNPMPPPELAADAPVADVFVPGLKRLGVARGEEFELALPVFLSCGLGILPERLRLGRSAGMLGRDAQ